MWCWGDDIETPKAATGWRLEKGCPLPQQTRVLGSVMSSPSLARTGRSRGRKRRFKHF